MTKIQNKPYKTSLMILVTALKEREAEMFSKMIVGWLEDVGLEHDRLCLSQRPHSHSADCDCGADELSDAIREALIK